MECPEIQRVVAPWVDGDVSAADRAQVEEQLAGCLPCRQLVAEQSAARQVLRERRAALIVRAPLGLRARCAGAAIAAGQQHAAASRRRSRLLALAAAAVLFFGTGGAVYATRGTNTSLAAQLALDHLKCFALFGQSATRADAHALAATLRERYGWDIKVPAGSADQHLLLVGGRRCFSLDGRVAHILYRHDGHALSLFLVPDSARPEARLEVIGHQAVIWSRNGTTFVVVAREPAADLDRVSGYLQRALN
jgi:anti-sigma factor RsiW